MTEADLSDKNLGAGGAIIIAGWLTHKDNGALTSLNLANNSLGMKDAGKALGAALAVNTVLKQLDLSKNYFNSHHAPRFAKELAIGLRDNGALIKLDISNNHIRAEQERDLQRICVAGGIELTK